MHLLRLLPPDRGRHRAPREAPACRMEDHRPRPGGRVRDSREARHPGPRHEVLQRAVGGTAPEGHAGQGPGSAAGRAAPRRAHVQPGHQAPARHIPHAQEDLARGRPPRGDDQPRPEHRRPLLRQHHPDERREDLRGREARGCAHAREHPHRVRRGERDRERRGEALHHPPGRRLRRRSPVRRCGLHGRGGPRARRRGGRIAPIATNPFPPELLPWTRKSSTQ